MSPRHSDATPPADPSLKGFVIPESVRNRTPVALAVGDCIREYRPRRPGVYLRTSCDRRGDERAIDLQLHDSEGKRIRLGSVPVKSNETNVML